MRTLYLYQKLDNEDKSILKVKNSDGIKIEVDYLNKRAFKNFCAAEDEAERKVLIVGTTKFKLFEGDEEECKESNDDFMFLQGSKYYVANKKKLFNYTKGYVMVEPVGKHDLKTTYFIEITRLCLIPLLLWILLPLLLLFLLNSCPAQKDRPVQNNIVENITIETTTKSETKLPIDNTATDWNGEMPTNPSSAASQEEIEFVGYDKLTVSKKDQIVELINPYGNTVYFKYIVSSDNEILYETKLIPPGKSVKWNAYSTLINQGFSSADGEKRVTFQVSTYDINTQSPCNPANIKTTITVI